MTGVQTCALPIWFGAWISEIYLYCSDDFIANFNEQDRIDFPFAKDEKQLREAVAKLLPEIQKYC